MLRQYLAERNGLPDASLVATSTVSVHRQVRSPWAQQDFGHPCQPSNPAQRSDTAPEGHCRSEFGCQATWFGYRCFPFDGLIAVLGALALISCAELLPDLWEMSDEFAVGMEEVLAAAG